MCFATSFSFEKPQTSWMATWDLEDTVVLETGHWRLGGEVDEEQPRGVSSSLE